MLLDIKPIRVDGHDCLEDSVASLATWWNRSYELIFIESWGFYLDQNHSDTFGNRIRPVADPENIIKMQGFLERFHGIQCTFHSPILFSEVLQFLKFQIQAGCPVACFFDIFWCPCSHDYKKRHASHWLLVVGMDEAAENLFYIDPILSKKCELIRVDDFMEGYKGYDSCVTFRKKNLQQSHFSWRKIIQNAVRNLKSDAVFERIRVFAAELEKNVDLSMEIGNSYFLWDAPLMKRIQEVKSGRLKFILALQYLIKRFGVVKLEEVCRKLRYVVSRWDLTYAALMKSYASKKKEYIATAATRIREVADLEEDIARLLLDISTNKSVGKSAEDKVSENLTDMALPQMRVSRVVFLELKDHMNNRAFGDTGNARGIANFDGIGSYYLWKSPGAENILEAGEMKFHFPQPEDGSNDNISCQGQNIRVTVGEYHNIMLLGCAEMGSFTDNVILNYSDGQSEIVEFGFTNHTINEPIYGEVIACQVGGVGLDGDGNDVYYEEPVRIFAKSYIIRKKGKVVSVSLPDIPNIHIFAISFGIA